MKFITEPVRQRILENFNLYGDQNAQDAYLQSLIKVTSVERRRGQCDKLTRNFNFHYEVHVGEVVKVVCREAFASLHGIGVKRIRRVAVLKAEARSPKDMRGQHQRSGNVKPDEIIESIDDHIKTFPNKVAHYEACGRKCKYLSSELSVRKMFREI